jgi:hypothetical protein
LEFYISIFSFSFKCVVAQGCAWEISSLCCACV